LKNIIKMAKKKIKGITVHTIIGKKEEIEYPENKRLKRMQAKANRIYKEMTTAIRDSDEAHARFHSRSVAYAKLLLEIEAEAKMPNFGER